MRVRKNNRGWYTSKDYARRLAHSVWHSAHFSCMHIIAENCVRQGGNFERKILMHFVAGWNMVPAVPENSLLCQKFSGTAVLGTGIGEVPCPFRQA